MHHASQQAVAVGGRGRPVADPRRDPVRSGGRVGRGIGLRGLPRRQPRVRRNAHRIHRIVRRSRAGARRGRCARQPRPAGRPAAESQHQRHRPVPRVRQHAAQAARHRHRRTPVPGDPAEPERRNHRRHPRVHLHHRRRRIRHHSDECARLHGRFHHDPLATRPPDHRRGHSLRRPRQHRHRPGRIQPSGIPFRGVFSYAILDPKALAVLKTATASRSAKITK